MIRHGTLEICVIFSRQSVCIVHILLKGHQESNCSCGLTSNVRNRIGFYLASLLYENKVIVIIVLFCVRCVNQWCILMTMHGNSISHWYICAKVYLCVAVCTLRNMGRGKVDVDYPSEKGGMRWFSSKAQGRTYGSVWLRALSVPDNLSKRETAADWPLRRTSFLPGELILARLNFKHLA